MTAILEEPKTEMPPAKPEKGALAKTGAFAQDFFSDPAIIFVAASDPLIFMLPKHLDVPHSEGMHDIVAAQAVAALISRGVVSYIHVNHPEFAHSKFFDNLPLRISGYTHFGMGVYLGLTGQFHKAAIAFPLGLGNLRLTGDLGAAERFVFGDKQPKDNASFGSTLASAYGDANANFAVAQFFVLTPPLAALGAAISSGKLSGEIVAQALPAVPLAIATYYIGKNVLNNERAARQSPNMLTFHNAGYPTILIGATAALGGLAGIYGLHAKGTLEESYAHLGATIIDASIGAIELEPSAEPVSHQELQKDTYVAGISAATILIGAAYALLERKYGTFFKPGRPKVQSFPKPGAEAPVLAPEI